MKKSKLAALIGAGLAASISGTAMADQSAPFQAERLQSGYNLADNSDANQPMPTEAGDQSGKDANGSCGAKDGSGSCGAKDSDAAKDASGSCGAKDADAEDADQAADSDAEAGQDKSGGGKCGAGKCGS